MTSEVLNRIRLEKSICQQIRFKIASDENWIVAGPFQPNNNDDYGNDGNDDNDRFLHLYNVNKHEAKFLCYPEDQVSISQTFDVLHQ